MKHILIAALCGLSCAAHAANDADTVAAALACDQGAAPMSQVVQALRSLGATESAKGRFALPEGKGIALFGGVANSVTIFRRKGGDEKYMADSIGAFFKGPVVQPSASDGADKAKPDANGFITVQMPDGWILVKRAAGGNLTAKAGNGGSFYTCSR
ncbi:TPA: hypothetical protein VDU83_006746 [Pseudomonas aeruginosa]|nr:hypothetical protein [Pseudomonas aeruginosa]